MTSQSHSHAPFLQKRAITVVPTAFLSNIAFSLYVTIDAPPQVLKILHGGLVLPTPVDAVRSPTTTSEPVFPPTDDRLLNESPSGHTDPIYICPV